MSGILWSAMVMCYVIFIILFSFQNHWNLCKFEFTSAMYTTSEFRVFNLYIFLKVCTVIMVIRQYDVGKDGENSIWEQRLLWLSPTKNTSCQLDTMIWNKTNEYINNDLHAYFEYCILFHLLCCYMYHFMSLLFLWHPNLIYCWKLLCCDLTLVY